jgi:3-dehydroquinate synthase
MSVLTVRAGDSSYPIHIGSDILTDASLFAPHVGAGGVVVVTNETVAPLYLETVQTAIGQAAPAGARRHAIVLADGEQHKTAEVLASIWDALISERFSRDVTIIALGGGVIGDMAGFAAATYQRGVRYIQVPTTLLSQVDSSVGGKTAVNRPSGKNMVGAFYQPACVIADTLTLTTLPIRELRCGLAETIKYGLIRDPEFFDWIETNLSALLACEDEALAFAVERACQNKADVVAADEREHGERALLNFGHTFGHAIETGLGHGQWLHGEAVAAGMCMAADMSARLGRLRQDELARINSIVHAAGLPRLAPASVSAERMLDLMAVDKKVLAGKVRLILLDAIGAASITSEFDGALLAATLQTCREAA